MIVKGSSLIIGDTVFWNRSYYRVIVKFSNGSAMTTRPMGRCIIGSCEDVKLLNDDRNRPTRLFYLAQDRVGGGDYGEKASVC